MSDFTVEPFQRYRMDGGSKGVKDFHCLYFNLMRIYCSLDLFRVDLYIYRSEMFSTYF